MLMRQTVELKAIQLSAHNHHQFFKKTNFHLIHCPFLFDEFFKNFRKEKTIYSTEHEHRNPHFTDDFQTVFGLVFISINAINFGNGNLTD